MPSHTLRSRKDVEDFVRGCSFFGTGGGGTRQKGITVLSEQLEAGREIKWVDIEELDEETWVVCPGGMGSIAPPSGEMKSTMEGFGLGERKYLNYLTPAIKELARYTGKTISAIIASELGGSNTPAPLATGAELGMAVIDGDYAGRAKPEITQSTTYLAGKSICPVCTVDPWGNICFIDKVANDLMAERIGKMIAVAAFGAVGLAGRLLQVKEVKEVFIRGTLTESLRLGQAIREAREGGEDPISSIVGFTGGWLLFQGRVTGKKWEDKEGYYRGEHLLAGVEEFAGRELKIWFKNENHISWLDDRPFVTSPDIIAVVDLKTGEPLVNHHIETDDQIAVIGVKARHPFRTERGLAVLGPRHFRFDLDYTPIEDLMTGD